MGMEETAPVRSCSRPCWSPGQVRALVLMSLLLASTGALSCALSDEGACAREPAGAIEVSLDTTQPTYSESFAGTIESVGHDERLDALRIVVRRDDRGGSRTLFFRGPEDSNQFPVGAHFRFQVDHMAGFPTLSAILLSDDRGLAFAAVSDQEPGQNVLRGGIPGFRIEFLPATCNARTGGECYDSLTNLALEITHGEATVTLMHGQSIELGDYRVRCLRSQLVEYSDHCADAGVIALSYVIVRSDLLD